MGLQDAPEVDESPKKKESAKDITVKKVVKMEKHEPDPYYDQE